MFPSHAQDLHPQHHQDYLDAMNLHFFAYECRFLMVAFRTYRKNLIFGTFLWPAGCIPSIPPHLWYFLCLVNVASEPRKILSAKIGSVPVSCVVASLVFPASSASGT